MLNQIYYFIFKYVISSAKEGRLVVEWPHGRREVFGAMTVSAEVRIKVTHADFLKTLVCNGEAGWGISYAAGFWKTTHLTPVLNFLFLNQKYFNARLKPFRAIQRFLRTVFCSGKEAVRTSAEGCDSLSSDFFSLWLDSSMTYSCAVFQKQGETLEQAQQNKIRRIIQSLEVSKTDHVLEVGCGWGGCAIQAVRATGCRWTGLTLSKDQKAWADQRIQAAGLQDQIQILVKDCLEMEGMCDKIVSIEAVETAGLEHLELFLKQCFKLLKPGGKMALQSSVISQEYYSEYLKSYKRFHQPIFFRGPLPSLQVLEECGKRAGLIVKTLHHIGLDYSKTVSLWCKEMLKHEGLISQMGHDRAFIRKWEYDFCYTEAGFLTERMDNIQLILQKPNNL